MLKNFIRRLRRGERGQDLVEFALVLPILLLLIMGMLDFGRVFNSWLVITHGAREGARLAAVGYSAGEVVARVQSTTGSGVAVAISPAGAPGQPVVVMVSTNVELLTGIIAERFLPNPVRLSSRAEMRYEGPRI